MHINAHFDGGNIEVLSCTDPQNILLNIRKDTQSEFLQWFSFVLYAPKGTDIHINIQNAHATSYIPGWQIYRARYSYGDDLWYQAETEYDGGLHITHIMQADMVSFAYFAPYPLSRHKSVLQHAQKNGASLHCLGTTIQGRSMDLLRAGSGNHQIWLIARQHPGETMAEWWMEGFIEKLLDPFDALSQELLQKATIHMVPNMNPDGSFLGNLRTNAVGTNLNREWQHPQEDRSPEVLCVRNEMHKTGVDFALDVHGDEGLPYNFFAGPEGIPSYDKRKKRIYQTFTQHLLDRCPDFQTAYGYPKTPPGRANLAIASNYIAEIFDCVAITIEQPFKDSAITPMPQWGWSPQRAKKFGATTLDALHSLLSQEELR